MSPVDQPSPAPRPPGLGPHCVGTRVVVRRVVGGTGPTGGPAMTDLLGVMLDWGPTSTTVQPEDGDPVVIALADIVSGKAVPPRPSVLLRVSAEEAERRALAGWPPVVTQPLGEWVLRAAGGFSSRANSVLAVGDPGLPVAEALGRVRSFYDDLGLPAWAQVVVGSATHAEVEAAGWLPARPDEADTLFQVGSVAQVSRALRRAGSTTEEGVAGRTGAAITLSPNVSDLWLSHDPRAAADPATARAVLESAAEVGFATATSPDGTLLATGRISHDDDWAGITDVWVSGAHRRQGLALGVVGAMLEWAAERGARTAYLQARGDNPAALALYGRLGFRTHHAYRYLAAA